MPWELPGAARQAFVREAGLGGEAAAEVGEPRGPGQELHSRDLPPSMRNGLIRLIRR